MKTIHCKVISWIVLLLIFFLGTEFCFANDGDVQVAPFKHLGVDINCGLASYREDMVVPLGFDGKSFRPLE